MPESTLFLGNSSLYTNPGTPGYTDDFPYTNLNSYPVRRFVETFMATAQGSSLQYKPSWNDVVATYRTILSKGIVGVGIPGSLIAGFSPGRLLGQLNPPAASLAVATTYVDPVTGVTVTMPGNSNAVRGVIDTVTTGQVTIPAQNDNLMIVSTMTHDPGLWGSQGIILKQTDVNNWLRLMRTAAATLSIDRDVASVVTNETTATVPAGNETSAYCLGLRVNGSRCRAFMDGVLYADFTLSGAAQGLTGTNAAISLSDATVRVHLDAVAIQKVT